MLSKRKYNLIIGLVLLYGLILNIFMVNFCQPLVVGINPIVFIVSYIVSCSVGVILTKSSSALVSFIGYNFIVVPIGIVLTICLPNYDPQLIMMSIIATSIVVFLFIVLSILYPKFFMRLGVILISALIFGIIAEIICMLFGYTGDLFNWLFVIIFSFYVGYDWVKAQSLEYTVDNAVDSAVSIYLDIINLFLRLLEIMAKKDD